MQLIRLSNGNPRDKVEPMLDHRAKSWDLGEYINPMSRQSAASNHVDEETHGVALDVVPAGHLHRMQLIRTSDGNPLVKVEPMHDHRAKSWDLGEYIKPMSRQSASSDHVDEETHDVALDVVPAGHLHRRALLQGNLLRNLSSWRRCFQTSGWNFLVF